MFEVHLRSKQLLTHAHFCLPDVDGQSVVACNTPFATSTASMDHSARDGARQMGHTTTKAQRRFNSPMHVEHTMCPHSITQRSMVSVQMGHSSTENTRLGGETGVHSTHVFLTVVCGLAFSRSRRMSSSMFTRRCSAMYCNRNRASPPRGPSRHPTSSSSRVRLKKSARKSKLS